MHKFEHPRRVAELSPVRTLRRLGLLPDGRFLDVGAGTGLFTFEAAKLTAAEVFAVEISGEMLEILREKREAGGFRNVEILDGLERAPDAIDLALLCTVLHELAQPQPVLTRILHALKPGGRLAVIEFQGRPTPMGPPASVRIGVEQASLALERAGFVVEGSFDLGEDFYCLTARSPDPA